MYVSASLSRDVNIICHYVLAYTLDQLMWYRKKGTLCIASCFKRRGTTYDCWFLGYFSRFVCFKPIPFDSEHVNSNKTHRVKSLQRPFFFQFFPFSHPKAILYIIAFPNAIRYKLAYLKQVCFRSYSFFLFVSF